ncbi:MAG TPA: TadE family protein [Polyangiaceae bacterium]|nr:TadE family protein [Polyangiaceae bacterium]
MTLPRDERGAVYVEFLFAFPPLFLLFLGICQLCLVATAKLVVQHAANRAVRTAIVVLNDDPEQHGKAERGSLRDGQADAGTGMEDLLAGLGVGTASPSPSDSFGAGFLQSVQDVVEGATQTQGGARMRPIRNAAYQPLLTLAPRLDGRSVGQSLEDGLPNGLSGQLTRALAYTRGAAVVTVQAAPGSAVLAESVEPKATVTIRVTYFYQCSVPIVRALVCRSLARLLAESFEASNGNTSTAGLLSIEQRFDQAEDPRGLLALARDSFFTVLEAETTLPNQGADSYQEGGS